MKPALFTLAALSVALNAAYATHLWRDYQATESLCLRLDRNRCAMRPMVISQPLDAPSPAPHLAEAGSDPIGDLIRQAEARGLPVPPTVK